MKYLIALALVLGGNGLLWAQTHPCDALPSTVVVVGGSSLSVLFCAKPADDLVRVDVTVDNATAAPYIDVAVTAQTGLSATGFVQYKLPLGVLLPGVHTVSVLAVNVTADGVEQVSDLSDPLTFTVQAPKPKPAKPKVTGVTK